MHRLDSTVSKGLQSGIVVLHMVLRAILILQRLGQRAGHALPRCFGLIGKSVKGEGASCVTV
jgi:hypothetical protein